MTTMERTFARVETALKGYARLMPEGHLEPLFSGLQSSCQKLPDAVQSGLPETLLQYLRCMDEKINTILNLLTQQSLQDDFPIQTVVHDISGAGLRFSSSHAFSLGDHVEMVVALANQPQGLASATGVIIREDRQNGQSLWALGFQDMRDLEREKIVQYVVARQREELRGRHRTD